MIAVHEAPEFMFNEDGQPMAVRADLVQGRRRAWRWVSEEFDWWMDDFPCVQIGDEDAEGNVTYRPILSEYRHAILGIKLEYMRPWRPGDDDWGEFGREAWFWCIQSEPNAIAYWNLGRN